LKKIVYNLIKDQKMKKVLLFAFVVFSLNTNAQITVWEDSFNDADATGWTLLDLDGNASNWIARTDLNVDENYVVIDGSHDILGSYNIDLVNLMALGSAENNWAISPSIDLSYYGGPISLVLNAQCAIIDGTNQLYVYASTSPEQSSFTPIGTVVLSRQTESDDEFIDYSVDMSQFTGQSEVYFALVTNAVGFIGVEINTVRIDAQSILGIKDTNEPVTSSSLRQNPVSESLLLQLGNTLDKAHLDIKVYNVNGMLIKDVAYNETGISVSELSSGLYFVVLDDGSGTERLKFIKK
jgi:Secretion system C-terminal sorting domain